MGGGEGETVLFDVEGEEGLTVEIGGIGVRSRASRTRELGDMSCMKLILVFSR